MRSPDSLTTDVRSGPGFDGPCLELPERRAPRVRVFAALLAVLSLLAGMQALSASAETVEDLRGDIPTGDEIRAELADIADERAAGLVAFTSAEARLSDVLFEREQLDDDQRRLASEIEAATANLRRLAVEAFMIGGDVGALEYLAAVDNASDFAWHQYLIRLHVGSSKVAVDRLRLLREQADDDVLETIAEAELQAVMPLAEAWDRAAIAIESGRYGIAPADKWERLRFCESTHNYQAISPSGMYRGAYQFDIPTWYTVGGTGDPAQAPPEEQDARARELYARRGPQPWPVCGRHLE